MKSILTILLSVLVTGLTAQKNEQYAKTENVYALSTSKLTHPIGVVLNEEQSKQYLIDHLGFQEPYELRLINIVESQNQRHYTFIQTFENKDVYLAEVKMNTLKNGTITSVFNNSQEIQYQKESAWPEMEIANSIEQKFKHDSKLVWAQKNGEYYKCLFVNYTNQNNENIVQLLDATGDQLHIFDRSQHFTETDTIVKGYVFAPDPVSSASTTYGGSFIDANDATNPSIDDERIDVKVKATFNTSDNTFYLENDYIQILDFDPPAIPPATSLSPDFYFDRSESGFENFNVIYHITQQQEYIQSLGINNLVNYAIHVDCHALNGSDNSMFNPNFNPPRLFFGEGGVDDAEDTDVIIHEYSHAIMHSASNSNVGAERNALDEAFGDYMAASYSRLYTYWADCCVYNWDGHNEYWNGRKVTSTAIYPGDLQNNLYKDAPIWSSALLRIERNIGRDSTNMVLLNAIFNFSNNMSMADAAKLVLEQDSLIFNEKYYAPICYTFLDKGLVSSCKVSRPGNLVGLEDLNPYHLKMLNSEGFAQGTGNIKLHADENFEVAVYDVSGKLINNYISNSKGVTLVTSNFEAGVYILKISIENEVNSIKISKY